MAKYRNYFLAPHYWRRALSEPQSAWDNLIAVIRHPLLYKNIGMKVEGWTDHYIGVLLYEDVLECKSASPNIIEVGAYKGLSTCYLSIAASKVGKRVKSFELFSGLPTCDAVLDSRFYEGQFASEVKEYETYLRTCGRREIVDLVIGDARQTMLPALGGNGFSLAFLDVDVYEVMRELLSQLWGLARGGETIIVHDVDSHGVRRAIDEFHSLSGNSAKELFRAAHKISELKLP